MGSIFAAAYASPSLGITMKVYRVTAQIHPFCRDLTDECAGLAVWGAAHSDFPQTRLWQMQRERVPTLHLYPVHYLLGVILAQRLNPCRL